MLPGAFRRSVWGALEPGRSEPVFCDGVIETGAGVLVPVICAWILAGQTLAQAVTLEPLEPLEPEMAPAPARAAEPLEPMAPASAAAPARPVQSRSEFVPGMEVWVTATSLGFRSGPGTEAPLIHYIPQHDRVTVLTDTNPSVEEIIAGRPGWWIYVQHGARRGYVFDAYVEVAPETVTKSLEYECVPGVSAGPITRYTSYADLEQAFGRENLAETEVDFGSGTAERVTKVFPDSDRELQVRWEIYKQTPVSVRVLGPLWQTPAGIAVGTRVSTMNELNGRHFAFYGFGWKFAGQVTSWEGGALETDHALRDTINITLAPMQPYVDADFETLQGTTEFTSDHPMAPRVNLRVESMTIMLNP